MRPAAWVRSLVLLPRKQNLSFRVEFSSVRIDVWKVGDEIHKLRGSFGRQEGI